MNARKILVQASVYGLFILAVGGFSNAPKYHRLKQDEAEIRLAFSHFGQPIRECRRRSQTELAELPPNMRTPMDCPRQRLPIQVTFDLDAQQVFQASIPASGIWGDGEATVYERFVVAAGPHRLQIKMRDSIRREGFDHQLDEQVFINALQNVVIGFDPGRKQFVLH